MPCCLHLFVEELFFISLTSLRRGDLLLLALISWVSHEVLDEGLVLHSTVAVDLDTLEDLIDLLLLEALTEGGEDVLDLDGEHVTVALLVEDLHTLEEVLLGTGGWELANGSQNWEELIKGDLLSIEISFGWLLLASVEGSLPLLVGWGPAEGSDGATDLVPVDLALALVIEEFPVVLPLLDLVAAELVCHLMLCWELTR